MDDLIEVTPLQGGHGLKSKHGSNFHRSGLKASETFANQRLFQIYGPVKLIQADFPLVSYVRDRHRLVAPWVEGPFAWSSEFWAYKLLLPTPPRNNHFSFNTMICLNVS